MGSIKIYKFLHSKGNHKQNENTIQEWDKIFADNVTEKVSISKKHK